ncbi:hypothetical protein BGZ93_008064 [Podila epicladia]|nr:hypothetical protein BGZ92_009521 [Podila epicladia]KAG0099350.1 hypothetical protein BGZ93_008064 [Podila epicladia]
MLDNKTFRPLFIAAAAANLLLVTIEVALAADTVHKFFKFTIHALRCVVCDEPPECNLPCRGGYCDINWCTCRHVCKKGVPQ